MGSFCGGAGAPHEGASAPGRFAPGARRGYEKGYSLQGPGRLASGPGRPPVIAGALRTVVDGHATGLSWLGEVAGHRPCLWGEDHFGQSRDIPNFYRLYGLDVEAIVEAVASACLLRRGL